MADSATILLQTEKGSQDITPMVSRFVYKNSLLSGHVRWRMKFDVDKWDQWKSFLIGNGLRFAVKVRDERPTSKVETDWLSLVVDDSATDIFSTVMAAEIVGGGLELGMMNKAKRRAFTQMTVSAVLQRIAAEYTLTPRVGTTTGAKDWYQTNQTDWEFIQEVMSYYLSSNGRGDVYLNVDGQEITAKEINFAAPVKRKFNLTQAQLDDRVRRVKFRYYGGQAQRKGGMSVEARAFDRKTGLPMTFTVSPLTAGTPSLKDRLPKQATSSKRVVVCADADINTLRATALRAQAAYGTRYYGVSVKVLSDLTIKLRDMFEISAKDADGKGSPNEGKYGVFEYTIDYSPKRTQTTIVGFRKESSVGPAQAVGAPASAVVGTDPYQTGRKNQTTSVVSAVPLGS